MSVRRYRSTLGNPEAMMIRMEGYEARMASAPAAVCPYAEQLLRESWMDGWREAARELRLPPTRQSPAP